MPDVVRLRNNYGHPVEVDVPGPSPEHGDVIDVPGRLITDMAEYRRLMDLPEDAVLGPDVDGYHVVFGPAYGPGGAVGDMLRGWPKDKWDVVIDAPPTMDTEA